MRIRGSPRPPPGSCASSTRIRGSTTRRWSSSASGSRPCCPTRWTRCFWSTPARRQAIWRSGSRPRRRAGATWSRSARPITAGRTARTRCRRRPPTTPMRLPRGRIGCTRSNRPTASAASTAVPRPTLRRRGGAADREAGGRRASARGVHLRERVRQCGWHGAAGRLPAAGVCGGAGGGGLAISDEVQVGYGRLGEWFWGSMQQDAVPDIVSIAKSTGNGYPLGAVITSRAVADAVPLAGLFLLVDRRQPAVVRDRDHGPRRVARRRAAGERRTRRRTPQGGTASAAGQAPNHRHRARHRAVPGRRNDPRRQDARTRNRGDLGDLRPHARTRRDHPADRRSP